MKKTVVLLMFLSLLVTSCAGTKYTSAKNTTTNNKSVVSKSNNSKEQNSTRNNKFNKKNLEDVYQEEVDIPFGSNTQSEMNSSSFVLADHIIETASDNLGVRYRMGGTTKTGFDCSGLVFTSFKAHNIALPRSSFDMAQHGQKIKDSEAQKGDLIFFITNGGKRINHVGIVTEVLEDEIKFVHSSVKLGVIISSTKEAYYKKNFVKVHRVL